jgi:predicted nucleotidyltransferase
VGRSRLLHRNEESPYFHDLYGLLLKAFGPVTLVGEELAGVEGVEQAYVYGSWAARYAGERGEDPVDVDVIVVGRPSRLAITRAERLLSERLGREVNAVVVTPEDWDAAGSGFLKEVRRRPVVSVPLDDMSA